LTRTTTAGQFDTSPGGGAIGYSTFHGSGTVSTSFTGTFLPGNTYTLRMYLKGASVDNPVTVEFGQLGTDQVTVQNPGQKTYYALLAWTPTAARSSVSLRLTVGPAFRGPPPGTPAWFIDTVELYTATPTIVDRRNFQRTKILQVSSPLPNDGIAAAQLGDTFLSGHMTTPFKGSATLTGDGSVRHILTGRGVGCERLLLLTGELLRFSDRPDPDTGAHGRDGRIAQVTYTPADDKAVVAIDNQRSSFEALLSRLAVVSGGT